MIHRHNNAIQYPSFNEKLPEPGRLQAAERSDRFRSTDGCTFHRSNRCKQRISDTGNGYGCRIYTKPKYFFDKSIYENRVFDSKGVADPVCGDQVRTEHQRLAGRCRALTENLVLKVVSEIHDPVTTTDELIPSGETSSYRSNPLALAEFALSRKDPAYVGRAKEVQKAEKARVKR